MAYVVVGGATVRRECGDVGDAVGAAVGDGVGDDVGDAVGAAVADGVGADVGDGVGAAVMLPSVLMSVLLLAMASV